MHRDAHRFLKVAKVGVDRAAVVAYQDDFTGLVGGYRQADVELRQDFWQVRGIDAAQRIGLGIRFGH